MLVDVVRCRRGFGDFGCDIELVRDVLAGIVIGLAGHLSIFFITLPSQSTPFLPISPFVNVSRFSTDKHSPLQRHHKNSIINN